MGNMNYYGKDVASHGTCMVSTWYLELLWLSAGDLYICEENEFICKDGNCLPMDKVCDENFDCEDKSDEDKSYCKSKYNYIIYATSYNFLTRKKKRR